MASRASYDGDGPDVEDAADTSADLQEVYERAIRRHDECASATQDQRALSVQARRFVSIPGAQWEGPWEDQFSNTIRVEINKTARGVEKIVDDYRANRLTVNFRAVGSKSSEHTAGTLEGLHRADAYHFKAQQARDNAFEEAASGGFGAWRLTTDYADPYDADSDEQRINPGMTITDADQRVFFDLNSKVYDKSDARFAFVLTAMSRDAYVEAYPDEPTSFDETLWKPHYDWFAPDVCIVAEYYEVEHLPAVRLKFEHALSKEVERFWDDELDPKQIADMKAQGWRQTGRRKVKRCRIHKYTMGGASILSDDGFIAGDCIPIIPVYGKRWYIDNLERWRGHVQLAMDPQRVYNAQISKLTETSAMAAREVPIFHPEQTAGHAADWARANVDRLPFLHINPMLAPDGTPIPGGPVGKLEAPQLSPVLAALIQVTANDISDLTNSQDGADQAKSNVSAEAMEIAATRVDAKAATYMDNMRQSVQREGEVYLSMARDIYFEPGREVEVMEADGSDDTETLHEGVTDAQGNYAVRNDIARGRYNVISDVMEATSTRRDKTVRAMLNIASVATAAQQMDLASAALITGVLNMDGEGLNEFQDFMRKKALQIGLVKPTDAEKQEMAAAAQQASQQPPDPNTQVLQAQAMGLAAIAKKDAALADKAVADTGLSKAKALEVLAGLHGKQGAAEHDAAHHTADLAGKHADTLATLAGAHAMLAGVDTAQHAAHTARLKVSHDVMNSEGASGPLAASQTLA